MHLYLTPGRCEGTSLPGSADRITGRPSEIGYRDVLRDWNPTKPDPTARMKKHQHTRAHFLLIQCVHHDNFDMWNSHYQPWNSVDIGPKRDLIGKWAKSCRADGIRFGSMVHHEYAWWWQTAFGSDSEGDTRKGFHAMVILRLRTAWAYGWKILICASKTASPCSNTKKWPWLCRFRAEYPK
jgi:alpha-L-fucosidase